MPTYQLRFYDRNNYYIPGTSIESESPFNLNLLNFYYKSNPKIHSVVVRGPDPGFSYDHYKTGKYKKAFINSEGYEIFRIELDGTLHVYNKQEYENYLKDQQKIYKKKKLEKILDEAI